jgi:hypothetical protein
METTMAEERFDHWLRTCAGPGSRRRLIAGLAAAVAAGAVGATAERGADAASTARKDKKKNGKGNACRNKPDGATCGKNGQCLDGKCRQAPTCDSAGSPCGDGQFNCCSGICVIRLGASIGACAPGDAGADCRAEGDCQSGRCVGFRCQA